MKKFFKLVFSRMMLVVVTIILQIIVSIILPYILNIYYPLVINNIFIPVDAILSLLALVLVIRIINSNMTIEGQLAWVFICLLFPILGIGLYFLFVRRRPPLKHRKYFKQVMKEGKKYSTYTEQEQDNLKQGLGEYYGQFNYLHTVADFKTYSNNSTKYLKTGELFYEELIKELENAKNFIFLEYFIIERGQIWNKILKVLEQKVREGVEVRVMYDDLGTINKLPNNYAKRMSKLGIKCVKFNSFVPIISAFHNNRDHRKIAVIDGQIGFISGLNIADEYANLVQPYGYWKDTGVKIEGEAVKNLTTMFLQLFNVQSMKNEEFSKYLVDIEKPVSGNGFVCPYGDGPRFEIQDRVAVNVYLNMIDQAKKYIWITTPYLILDNKLRNALMRASRRGVDVRIITPHIPDKKIIFGLTRSNYKNLQEAGVKIYEFEKGFIHSKQILCDDEIGIVGTINFDYRSLLHHYECGVLMCKTDCLKDIKSDFEHLFAMSIDMKDYKQNAFLRLLCAVIKIFTPML